jgi:hypothetical protein
MADVNDNPLLRLAHCCLASQRREMRTHVCHDSWYGTHRGWCTTQEEEQLRESLKNHPHLTLDELREFKELFNLVGLQSYSSVHIRW